MKKSLFFIVLVVFPLFVLAQASGGQITRKRTNATVTTAAPKKTAPAPKTSISKKSRSTGQAGRSSGTVSIRKNTGSATSGMTKVKEAPGYEVTFTCNVPNASMMIDGEPYGEARGSRYLMRGSHTVKLVADGYEDYSKSIIVNSEMSFSMTMRLHQSVKDRIIQKLVNNMVYVEGGTFVMGSNVYTNEKPIHEVTLTSFFIGRYEVTQEEWMAVMGSNPSKSIGSKQPVENVSWEDCQVFISKLNAITGRKFRLPTESEWEFAARGGKKSRGYENSGSRYIGEVAWYSDNAGAKTHPVGTKQPNELGLYDMSGNVWEWCNDWYGEYSYQWQTNPTGPYSGSNRVLRGGSWQHKYCSVSYRLSGNPSYRFDDRGFRLAQ